MDAAWCSVGEIVRPHGLRGEVRVLPLTDFPDRYRRLAAVRLEWPNGRTEMAEVVGGRRNRDLWVLRLRGVESIEAAERLRGARIQVRREERVPLGEGRWYVDDLVGSRVVDRSGQELGRLRDVLRTGANDVWVIAGPAGDRLLPALRSTVVRVDLVARVVEVAPLPGLWDETDAD